MRHRADFRGVTAADVLPLADGPWGSADKPRRENQRLFHEVVLGTVDVGAAIAALHERHVDRGFERPRPKGFVPVASVVLDADGYVAGDYAGSVSSFPWAFALAMEGDLAGLAGWPEHETRLRGALMDLLTGGQPLHRMSADDAERVRDGVFAMLGLGPDVALSEMFVLRRWQDKDSTRRHPAPVTLNSHLLPDLLAALRDSDAGTSPELLLRYLGAVEPESRADVLDGGGVLSDLLRPSRWPAARWPSPGGRSLVPLQQAAVNAASAARDGLTAVNGPPGTGKTTLLRDVVADQAHRRARAMVAFEDPRSAFLRTGKSIPAKKVGAISIFRLHESLRGHGILVASSNNRAVENVSKELPSVGSVDPGLGLRYFATLSDKVAGTEGATWGLISAVLGNSDNIHEFYRAAWYDDRGDSSIRDYLVHANGKGELLGEFVGNVDVWRQKAVVASEDCPDGPAEAARRWRDVRSRFLARDAELSAAVSALDGYARDLDELKVVEGRIRAACATLAAAGAERGKAADERRRCERQAEAAARAHDEAVAVVSRLERDRPGRLRSAAAKGSVRRWSAAMTSALERLGAASRFVEAAGERVDLAAVRLSGCAAAIVPLESEVRSLHEAAAALLSGSREAAARVAGRTFGPDRDPLAPDGREVVPWFDAAAQAARAELFALSMEVAKAFAGAAPEPFLRNGGAFFRMIDDGLSLEGAAEYAGDVVDTFFLLVPVASTAFASVARMFRQCGPGTIGTLVVDEAGQATPQAAVGALMRARRALVVGDPLQIEPVVQLPGPLVTAIHRRFSVDPLRYAAPMASVQTLADAAGAYHASYPHAGGTREVGMPLLLHRRCAEPMFSMSNDLAYGGLMALGRGPADSPLRDLLGPSAWLDVVQGAAGRWSEEEGRVALSLVVSVVERGLTPDLYVLSPFRDVADGLRARFRRCAALKAAMPGLDAFVQDRIGTIHTAQGRESEAVVVVLGARGAAERRARSWAGGAPNIANVVVTRAKEAIYVVGDRRAWSSAGCFGLVSGRLPDGTLPLPVVDGNEPVD